MNSFLIKTTIVFAQRHLLKIMLSIALISYYLYIIFFYSAEELEHKPEVLKCNDTQEIQKVFFNIYLNSNIRENNNSDYCRINMACDIWVSEKDITHAQVNEFYDKLKNESTHKLSNIDIFIKMLNNFSFRKHIKGEEIKNKTFIFDNFSELNLFNGNSIKIYNKNIEHNRIYSKDNIHSLSSLEALILYEGKQIYHCK